jgi:hypothetical protein
VKFEKPSARFIELTELERQQLEDQERMM